MIVHLYVRYLHVQADNPWYNYYMTKFDVTNVMVHCTDEFAKPFAALVQYGIKRCGKIELESGIWIDGQ